MRVKKIPQRMCVGCKEKKPKKELIRVVRTPEAQVEIDPTGKKSGRGAYICPKIECLTKAVKNKALDRSLEITITEEIITALESQLMADEAGKD